MLEDVPVVVYATCAVTGIIILLFCRELKRLPVENGSLKGQKLFQFGHL